MNYILTLSLGVFLLIALLFSEKKDNPRLRIIFKAALSFLFVLTVFFQEGPPGYVRYLTWGLILCFWGDVFLALPGSKWFKAGLVVFLLGHVLYIAAFKSLIPWGGWFSPGGLVVAAVSLGVFWWLRPHLGPMKIPVLAYVVVITLMVFGALAVYRQPEIRASGKTIILLGAGLFYLSDLFVARDQFVRKGFLNRLIGLPLYYAGQFLLAFSPGYL